MRAYRVKRLKPSDDPWNVPMTERELTKLIMDYLKWVPNSTFKKIRGSMGMRGILDIIGCWEGKYVELEVKTERGSLTHEQKARIEEIRQAGGMAEAVKRALRTSTNCLERMVRLRYSENSRVASPGFLSGAKVKVTLTIL